MIHSAAFIGLLAGLLIPEPQLPEYKLVASQEIKGRLLQTDNLRNSYVFTDQNELVLFNERGKKIFVFSEKRFGALKSICTSNPLKVAMLFPESDVIITLDNTLSPTGLYNLQSVAFQEVDAACLSFDNNIWIYDAFNFRIKKLDESLQPLQQSDPLNLLFGKIVHPNFLYEKNNWVYLNDPDNGIYVFDIYGTYYKTIPIKSLQKFQIIQEQIVYFKAGVLNSYHLKTFQEREIPLPPGEEIIGAGLEKNLLSILRKNQLDLYSF